jgi:hypothetical protein
MLVYEYYAMEINLDSSFFISYNLYCHGTGTNQCSQSDNGTSGNYLNYKYPE